MARNAQSRGNLESPRMTKFSDLKLDPKVLKAIAEAGYETPTPIQAGAIPPALEGRDVLGIAQTGTGKTASFTLPMITLLGRGRARARMPRSLVLCPTRELAAQVAENFDIYASHTKLTKALLIGGVSFAEQDKLIDRGVDVLIATPGRLLDHFERGKLLLTGVQIMVVDEADRMLDMGFIPDIERIFQLTPFTRQTLFFSATMAPEIERITNTFLHAPERIEVARQATASETITQRLIEISPTRKDQTAKQKRELLRALIDAEGPETDKGGLKNAIIFCNRKTDVDIVAKSLAKHGYDAAPIHGDLDQSHRTRTLESFRDGTLKLLIASDVAARGLDIPAVSHVFNFDLPSHAEDYIHRIGRTGRAGRQGTAISIATPSDDKYLSGIENLIKQTLPRGTVPQGFAPSEAASQAPRREREDRGGRGGRDKRRRDRRDDEGKTDAQDAQASRNDAPRAGKPAEPEAPRQERQERQESRGNDRRDDRRRGGGRGRGDDSRGPAVLGMGDHVPEFMLVNLRPAVDSATSTDNDAIEDFAAASVEDSKPASEKPAKPKRSRGRRSGKSAQDKSADDQQESQTADTSAQDDAQEKPAPQAEPEEKAPPKPRRSRRKATAEKSVEPEAEAADEAATEEKPKPRRTRARKPKAEETTPADAAAEDAPKPKRTRRKKADAAPAEAADAVGASETPEAANTEKAAPKPRRTRRKKADTAEPSEDQKPAGQPRDNADAEI